MLLHLEKQNDLDLLIKENKEVLIDFYAKWCGPCRMLTPVLEEVSDELPNLTIIKIDVDEFHELAAKYGVTAIPTMIQFKEGKIANIFRGYLSKEDLIIELNK